MNLNFFLGGTKRRIVERVYTIEVLDQSTQTDADDVVEMNGAGGEF